MADDKCKDDTNCIASTKKFLKLQNKADDLASRAETLCKNWKGFAVAAAAAAALTVSAAAAAVTICAGTGWWFPPLCVAAVAIAAIAAAASIVAASAAVTSLVLYDSARSKCNAAKALVSAAYDKMIDDCDKECATKKSISCSC